MNGKSLQLQLQHQLDALELVYVAINWCIWKEDVGDKRQWHCYVMHCHILSVCCLCLAKVK